MITIGGKKSRLLRKVSTEMQRPLLLRCVSGCGWSLISPWPSFDSYASIDRIYLFPSVRNAKQFMCYFAISPDQLYGARYRRFAQDDA